MKKETEILSVDIQLGVPGHSHITHIQIWPRSGQASIWEQMPGCAPRVVGEISIISLIEILNQLKTTKSSNKLLKTDSG